MQPLDLLTLAVLAFFGSRLLVSFRRSLAPDARRHSLELVRGLRLRHFLPVPLVLAAVIAAAFGLTSIHPLDFGWWTAIGGQGNPAFGVTDRTAGTAYEIIVPVLFVVLLVPALPLLVEREEMAFRLGAEGWSTTKRIFKAVLFGLIHAIIGIPIGVALALSIGGAYFTLAYLRRFRATGSRRAAIFESTRCHLAYNLSIVALVAVVLVAEIALTLVGAAGDASITVTSPAFEDGDKIPARHSCEYEGESPPLRWSGVPDEAVEVAVVVSDAYGTDGTDGPFFHWLLVGLAPSRTGLAAGEVPADAVQAPGSSENPTYIGMCPPTGDEHEYLFTVHALDEPIAGRIAGKAAPEVVRLIESHSIAEGSISGRYGG